MTPVILATIVAIATGGHVDVTVGGRAPVHTKSGHQWHSGPCAVYPKGQPKVTTPRRTPVKVERNHQRDPHNGNRGDYRPSRDGSSSGSQNHGSSGKPPRNSGNSQNQGSNSGNNNSSRNKGRR